MRFLAFFCLVFGFMFQLLLDGQVYTHAVSGIACGVTCLFCGIGLIRQQKIGKAGQWEGWPIPQPGSHLCRGCQDASVHFLGAHRPANT
jgi:hypothetical protein